MVYKGALWRFSQLPLTDQCQGSLGRLYSPNRPALAASHWNAELERLVMREPLEVKSMANPCSCMDVPGRAVGGEQAEAGELTGSGQFA